MNSLCGDILKALSLQSWTSIEYLQGAVQAARIARFKEHALWDASFFSSITIGLAWLIFEHFRPLADRLFIPDADAVRYTLQNLIGDQWVTSRRRLDRSEVVVPLYDAAREYRLTAIYWRWLHKIRASSSHSPDDRPPAA